MPLKLSTKHYPCLEIVSSDTFRE